ncbi:hypothetical protein LZ30DRAFT_71317 [Colletotrichum cereale]|nr:hypothetical protein LZ30DRAFT_71317 [Colletotrichum cereale]
MVVVCVPLLGNLEHNGGLGLAGEGGLGICIINTYEGHCGAYRYSSTASRDHTTYTHSTLPYTTNNHQRFNKQTTMMSTQLPRPTSNTTNSSNSTNSNAPFTGNMDAYTLSMYEHTKRLMAAAQIPYGSPASLLSPPLNETPAAGTSSASLASGLTPPKSGGLN